MSIQGKDDDLQALDQCRESISFLQYCAAIEQGGDEGNGKRDLDKDEEEIRNSALSNILLYLEKSFLQAQCQTKKPSKPSARTTSRGRSRKTSR